MASPAEYVIEESVRNVLCENFDACDPKLSELLEALSKHGASECWHKHGTFKQHLFGVWRILYLWKQPQEVCRCGLFHSAYSNSYVNLAIFKPDEDRSLLGSLVGEKAEQLIEMFCTVPRHHVVFDLILPNRKEGIPKEGFTVNHIRHKEQTIHLTPSAIRTIIILTIADICDQHFGWQDVLLDNTRGEFTLKGAALGPLWPGDGRPGLWMSGLSRLACLARSCEGDCPLPPIFDCCTKELTAEDEAKALDCYWHAVCHENTVDKYDESARLLLAAIEANPFVAEPHVLLAQIYNFQTKYEDAVRHATAALKIFLDWGACYDKRMPWEAWVAWTRVLLDRASEKNWPHDSWSIISLGMVK